MIFMISISHNSTKATFFWLKRAAPNFQCSRLTQKMVPKALNKKEVDDFVGKNRSNLRRLNIQKKIKN